MTHHFIHGHPSRKQTVTLYLKDSIIAVQDFKKGRKWVDVLCSLVNLQISWPSQNVWAANVHRQMCSQQMSNWRMSGHPFLMGFFLSKSKRQNAQFFDKKGPF